MKYKLYVRMRSLPRRTHKKATWFEILNFRCTCLKLNYMCNVTETQFFGRNIRDAYCCLQNTKVVWPLCFLNFFPPERAQLLHMLSKVYLKVFFNHKTTVGTECHNSYVMSLLSFHSIVIFFWTLPVEC